MLTRSSRNSENPNAGGVCITRNTQNAIEAHITTSIATPGQANA